MQKCHHGTGLGLSKVDSSKFQTLGCDKVGDFIDAIGTKVRLTQLGLSKDHGPLALRITETGEALSDDLPLEEISQQPGFRENSCQMPLLVVVQSIQWSECLRLESLVPDRPAIQSLFEVPAVYLPMSDVALDCRILFCRPLFWKQFTFLDEVLHTKRRDARPSHNPYSMGWILGAPGTGKSTSTLAFLSTIDQGFWAITWLAFGSVYFNYIHIVAGQMRTGAFLLRSGLSQCLSMLGSDFREAVGVEEFLNESWTKEEYLSAVHKDFYERIKENFDSTACRKTLKDEVNSKYYFSGGSARFMFATKTSNVIAVINHGVAQADNIEAYLPLTRGECSKSAMNRLISCYGNGGNDTISRRYEIVSQFAASKLATGLEKSEINYLNPAIGRWFVDIWFFATLKRTGFSYYHDDSKRSWRKYAIHDFDPTSITSIPVWLKPLRWNQ
ncbi:unnamed protein product [Calypogeia fissa]